MRLPAPVLAAAISGVLTCTPLPAIATYGGGLETKCSTQFAGIYTDPINHPGGKRSIFLNADGNRPAVIFDNRIATVVGGGGQREPSSYRLDALITKDDAKIVIDFSAKGGPADFPGVLETRGDEVGIRFLKDKRVSLSKFNSKMTRQRWKWKK